MGWLGDQIAALSGDDFPAAVLAVVSLLTVGVASWALLILYLAWSPALRGLALALTPRILHGVVLAGVAGALNVPAAHADDRGVDGLRLPGPADGRRHGETPDESTGRRAARRHLVVDRAGRLGPDADVAGTARACDRWYHANLDVIGDDPDLIHPGQRLTAPSKDRS